MSIVVLVTSLMAASELSGSTEAKEPVAAPMDEQAITIGDNGLWREAKRVVSSYDMVCASGTAVTLRIELSATGANILHLSVGDTDVDRTLVKEIESGVNGMGGLDYPYALCTNEKVRLAFDYKTEDGETRSVGWTLN